MVKKILFVCKFNRFRSKVAEAYFNKINKNKNIAVKSAGLFAGSYPLDSQQVKLAKKFGIKIKKKPRAMSAKLLSKINKIIIVADDVPKNLFLFKGKYLQEVTIWKIKDEFGKECNRCRHKEIL